MTLSAFISAVGLLGAIIILRANQWVKYREETKGIATIYLGLIWSYSAVLIGFVATTWAILTTTENEKVEGVPLTLLSIVAIMAALDLLAPIASIILKIIKNRPHEKSWLKCLDRTFISYDDNQCKSMIVVNTKGKVLIIAEVIFILLTTILCVYITLRSQL